MTVEETARVLTVLGAVWTERVVTEDTVRAYQIAWADLPAHAVERAAAAWLRSGTFFPKPGELRRLALEHAAALPPADEAWLEVKRAVRDVGLYGGAPAWSTPLLARAAEALGYREFCMSEMSDEPIWRAQFLKLYDGMRERSVETSGLTSLGAPEERLRLVKGSGM